MYEEVCLGFNYTDNPNDAMSDIAVVLSANRLVLGMMPNPERAVDDLMRPPDGQPFFAGLAAQFVSA